MKRAIACAIENIISPGEEAWIITIDHADVSDAIISLTALRLGKISQIKLADHAKTALLRPDSLTLADRAIPITAVWLDAVLSMLLNLYLNGLAHPAHLDQDFTTANGEICVCIAVAPPKN